MLINLPKVFQLNWPEPLHADETPEDVGQWLDGRRIGQLRGGRVAVGGDQVFVRRGRRRQRRYGAAAATAVNHSVENWEKHICFVLLLHLYKRKYEHSRSSSLISW